MFKWCATYLLLGLLAGFILWGFHILPSYTYHYKAYTDYTVYVANMTLETATLDEQGYEVVQGIDEMVEHILENSTSGNVSYEYLDNGYRHAILSVYYYPSSVLFKRPIFDWWNYD